MSDVDYKIKVRTGTIMVEGWTKGYGTIDGFCHPAPNWIVKNEKVMDFEEWQKATPQSKEE